MGSIKQIFLSILILSQSVPAGALAAETLGTATPSENHACLAKRIPEALQRLTNEPQYRQVAEYLWEGGRAPEQHFFENWQELMKGVDPGAIPPPGTRLSLQTRDMILATFRSRTFEVGHRRFLRASLTQSCDQEIIPNTELENRVIAGTIHNGRAVETRIIRLNTDQGPLETPLEIGDRHDIRPQSIAPQIELLLRTAAQQGRTVQGLEIRHLHPNMDFYDPLRNRYNMHFYNNADVQVMSRVSNHFRGLRISEGAVSPNGHTYRVLFLDGQLLPPEAY